MFSTARLLSSTLFAVGLASQPALAQTQEEPRESVVTAAPNAPDQEPAFDNQTRAPQPPQDTSVATEVVAEGLPHLWSMEFLPDGRMLVAAKEGAMHIVAEDGTVGPAIQGVPEVDSAGQGGLLDIALAPDFEESGRIYFSFAEPREGGNGTSVASATLAMNEEGAASLEDVSVIFRQMPTYDGDMHFGSRLVFGNEGNLFVTVGERSDQPIRDQAQALDSGLGKVFRITSEGEVPDDNPFVDEEGAQPEIWSYGHRNLQAATLDDEGRLWTVEHGPRGGDELNQPQAGLNYGWPIITYGLTYGGQPVGEGVTRKEGMEQPVYYWDPVIAPSGMAQYEGEEFPEWQGDFLIGGLVSQGLVVLHMEDGRVAYEERVPLDARVRDVKVGPDGAVYVVTENRNSGSSEILRLTNEG